MSGLLVEMPNGTGFFRIICAFAGRGDMTSTAASVRRVECENIVLRPAKEQVFCVEMVFGVVIEGTLFGGLS